MTKPAKAPKQHSIREPFFGPTQSALIVPTGAIMAAVVLGAGGMAGEYVFNKELQDGQRDLRTVHSPVNIQNLANQTYVDCLNSARIAPADMASKTIKMEISACPVKSPDANLEAAGISGIGKTASLSVVVDPSYIQSQVTAKFNEQKGEAVEKIESAEKWIATSRTAFNNVPYALGVGMLSLCMTLGGAAAGAITSRRVNYEPKFN